MLPKNYIAITYVHKIHSKLTHREGGTRTICHMVTAPLRISHSLYSNKMIK